LFKGLAIGDQGLYFGDQSVHAPQYTRNGTTKGGAPHCIWVLLRDLVWGDEVLKVPYPYVVVTILNEEERANGATLFQCDFGTYLGVQVVL